MSKKTRAHKNLPVSEPGWDHNLLAKVLKLSKIYYAFKTFYKSSFMIESLQARLQCGMST